MDGEEEAPWAVEVLPSQRSKGQGADDEADAPGDDDDTDGEDDAPGWSNQGADREHGGADEEEGQSPPGSPTDGFQAELEEVA